MGELTIRRNRGFAVPPYQGTEKAEKKSGEVRTRPPAPSADFTLSATLRQLMSRSGHLESQLREGHWTLRAGEAALDAVQAALGRMARLAQEAAGGDADGEALQEELEKLRESIDRILTSATAGGRRLFLDGEGGMEDDLDTLLYAVTGGASAGQEALETLPRWLTVSLTLPVPSPEELRSALGLDGSAGGTEILAAIAAHPPEHSTASAYLATLYLGAVIAGGGSAASTDPQAAAEGLRMLLEKVAGGASPDEALEELTGGAFTSLAGFQTQFTAGTAPGLEEFLLELLTVEEPDALPVLPLAPALLAGLEGMEGSLMLDFLSALPLPQTGVQGEALPPPFPGEAASATQESAVQAAGTEGTGSPAALAQGLAQTSNQSLSGVTYDAATSTLALGPVQVSGQSLSGVTYDAVTGTLTLGSGTDVTVQGMGEALRAICLTGSGTVTLRAVTAALLTAEAGTARLQCAEASVLGELRLGENATLTLGGGALLRMEHLRAGRDALLRLAGGAAAAVGCAGEAPGILTVPVVLEGPASLSAQAASVRHLSGKALEPFDIVWKMLLPGFASVTALAVDGRQARMSLLGGETPDPIRLWLAKGDLSAHGNPLHTLMIQGRDELNRPRTRYAYLHWSQQAGAFREIQQYPNPFTVTGGEENRDWVYEEGSQTLRILSSRVTAISGGPGLDAAKSPFSGRIVLADGIGSLELTLRGVDCQVSAGRAFSLGQDNDVTLYLESGQDNCFTSGPGRAGISLGDGTALRIDRAPSSGGSREEAGTLTASGGAGGAGIGRDSGAGRNRSSSILIAGGVITARGSGGGAGIGAGKWGFMGSVTITGGTVDASGGTGGGAGIGAGLGAPVGDIRIQGGRITAAALRHAAAIGASVQGESGDILISGTARILRASGGNPGADIGACLFGGCGKVEVSGAAGLGGAELCAQAGIPLPIEEETVTLPQFRISSRVLGLNQVQVTTRAYAQAARVTISAGRRWISQIQAAYSALYGQLEQRGLHSGLRSGPARDAAAASALLQNMRQSILLQSDQTIRSYSRLSAEDVRALL